MSKAPTTTTVVLNTEDSWHEHTLLGLFEGAVSLDCAVAFAKDSGMALMRKALKGALAKGLKARFVVGLDFYTTDPAALRDLLALTSNPSVKFYLGKERSGVTFHPKVYAFRYAGSGAVVAGSANLTSGGLMDNWEASLLTRDGGALADEVRGYIDGLIKRKEIVKASKKAIDDYAERHKRYHTMQKALARRVHEVVASKGAVDPLAEVLKEMRSDASDQGFDQQRRLRSQNADGVPAAIDALVATAGATQFKSRYNALIQLFHSDGLQRRVG